MARVDVPRHEIARLYSRNRPLVVTGVAGFGILAGMMTAYFLGRRGRNR